MIKKTIITILSIFFLCGEIFSQEDASLYIFGSLQSIFFHQDLNVKIDHPIDSTILNQKRSSFAVQQLDLFFNKSITDRWNVFVDLEFKLNYSSEDHWGSFNIEEAWLKYDWGDWLNIKAGMLSPKFNNLNEIKNRLALLPYIFRPVVYEGILSSVFELEDYVPDKAFLQMSGYIPFGIVRFDYAAYAGNSEFSNISNNKSVNSSQNYLTGVDSRDYDLKSYGTRIGLQKDDETFKTGISVTYDYDNKRDTIYKDNKDGPAIFAPPLGDIPRIRLGMDLSFSIWKFDFESEYINVFYDWEPPAIANPDVPDKMGQQFFYSTLIGNINDEIYLYGTYEFINDKFLKFDSFAYVLGAGYKFNNSIKAKIEYVNFEQENTYQNWNLLTSECVNYYMAAISVFF